MNSPLWIWLLFSGALAASVDICWDNFDSELRKKCDNFSDWVARYYFDHPSQSCLMFWYGGCRSSSRNVFADLHTCQWQCEQRSRYKKKACNDPFDELYRNECNGGQWKQSYYFDQKQRKCVSFWYDGCTGSGTSGNLFPDQSSCVQMCEKAESRESMDRTSQLAAATHPHRHHIRPKDNSMESAERIVISPIEDRANVCEYENPCLHGGQCVFDKLHRTYFCECVNGYSGRNCSQLNVGDPCSRNPCYNGASCSVKKTKTGEPIADCFCAFGFAGEFCEEKPCDPTPCKNGGICRTTKGKALFFCECSNGWGGKLCDIAIPNVHNRTYGKNVELLSSGKAEWVEELRRHKQRSRERMLGFTSRERSAESTNLTEPDDGLDGADRRTHQSKTYRLPAGSSVTASAAARPFPFTQPILSIAKTLYIRLISQI